MDTKRVHENHHEPRATERARPRAGSPPGRYAKEAAEAATRYLQDLARTRGEAPEADDLMFQGQAEAVPGRCPHCRYVYVARTTPVEVFKCGMLRRDDRTGRLAIKCRQCKRWMDLPLIA